MKVSTIGVDIAKSVFQVHGEDAEGKAIIQKRLGRKGMVGIFSKLLPCLVALEARGTSHYWGRALRGDGARGSTDPGGLCEAGSLPSGLTRG